MKLSAVLTQKVEDGTCHPVVYASRTLQPHGHNCGAVELEGLRVVWSVNHFDIFCMDAHVSDVY